jgi:hypothetical protein
MLVHRASNAAGIRLEFRTDSRVVGLRFHPLDASFFNAERDTLTIDLELDDGEIIAGSFEHGTKEIVWEDLPDGAKTVRIWLHQFTTFALTGIDVEDGCDIELVTDDKRKWTAYGSSITHSRDGIGPTGTWPAIVARRLGLDLTCLGFGGQCHLDPIYARTIRDIPADLISLKLGINTYGRSLSPRTYRPAIIGFVETIRERHCTTPLVLCSPIYSGPRESASAYDDGYSLEFMRSEISETVDLFRRRGDSNIYYVNGLDIAGPEFAPMMPDDTHPNGEAQPLLAENFISLIEPILSKT